LGLQATFSALPFLAFNRKVKLGSNLTVILKIENLELKDFKDHLIQARIISIVSLVFNSERI
jgi:hypothetical protein